MDLFNYVKTISAIVSTLGTIYVLYLCWGMIQFAKAYGKEWADAFKVFFICLCVILVRRGIGILWGVGTDGAFYKVMRWVDFVGVATTCTILYMIFLCKLKRWWTHFFDKYKIEETVVKQVIVEDANHVEIEDAKKIEVDLEGRQVSIDKPKLVLVEKPKKVEVKKDGVTDNKKE